MFTGVFGGRGDNKLIQHSGLLSADLDNLWNEDKATARQKLTADSHVFALFESPTATGLKVVFAVPRDPSKHLQNFFAVKRHVKEVCGLAVDEACKNPERLCYVSNDPNLYLNAAATPLPIQDLPETDSAAEISVIVLPSGNVSISESARAIFTRIAPSRTLFWRGGVAVEPMEQDGVLSLELVKPDAFRSRVERFGKLFAWRQLRGGMVLKPARMSRDMATAIIHSTEARELLPPVASVLRCPVLIIGNNGTAHVLVKGYHPEQGGILIVAGQTPPRVEIQEAVASLKWLLEEFQFQTEGDFSRGLAGFITPALRMGGFFSGPMDHVPIDVAEADQSQAGKGYRHHLVCALFNESGYFVTARKGGVGSTDESFAAALIAGRPFIKLDNFRGRLDSQHLEAFLTCPELFPARIPHCGEVMVDPKRFLLLLTINGMEATRDLANRSSICRIRKRPDLFNYRDTLGELQKRQPYYLGCVFSIIAQWISFGRPTTGETRHHFRRWCQSLDWIVQNICEAAPLMDGHEDAQERVSNPALSWVRQVALALEAEGRLGESVIATQIAELCQIHGLDIPGQRDPDEDHAKRQVGILMRRVFGEKGQVVVDGYSVTRGEREYQKANGN
jgi:hypothetical protein